MRYPIHRDSEPPLLQDPGPLAQFQRAWAIQGQLPALAEARVQLGIAVDDLTSPEFWWLRRGKRVMSQAQQAATAGFFSTYTLRVKASNIGQVLFIVEKLVLFNAGAATAQLRWSIGPQGPVTTFFDLQFMDDRQAATPSTFTEAGQDNTAAATMFPGAANTYMSTVIAPGGVVILENPGMIITGTQALNVQTAVVNQQLNLHVLGRERVLNPSER